MPLLNRLGGSGGGEHVEETIITASGTYTVPATGTYRIAAISAGLSGRCMNVDEDDNSYIAGEYYEATSGVCGGAGYLVTTLAAGETYAVTITEKQTSFGNLITATTGTINVIDYDDGSCTFGTKTSGSVSGAGVVAFESNNKTNQISIIPPAFWQNRASKSGITGSGSYRGGSGLFGGDGGNGRVLYNDSVNGVTVIIEGASGERGGGSGGTYDWTGGPAYNTVVRRETGSGGGGYGGGGGGCPAGRFYHGSPGTAGTGCVFIEKIG